MGGGEEGSHHSSSHNLARRPERGGWIFSERRKLKNPTVVLAKMRRCSEFSARDEEAVGTGEVGTQGRVPIMRESAWMCCLAPLRAAQSQAIMRHPQRLTGGRLAGKASWTPPQDLPKSGKPHMMLKGWEG